MLKAESTTQKDLASFDTLIIGSPVYIGRLLIKRWLKTNASFLGDKELIFFIVCGTPASERVQQESIAASNIPHELISLTNIFFLPGRVVRNNLSWKDRLMLKIGARLQKDPAKRASMDRDVDEVKKEYLSPILRLVASPLTIV
jgi:menaquinone-dependent protoporphyrinogen IX oxidase